MSNNDIRNIYESMRKGVKYVQPKRMTDLYSDVYSDLVEEATVTIDYGDGNVQTLMDVPIDKARQLLSLKDIDDNTDLLRIWVESGGWDPGAQKLLVFRLGDIYRNVLDFENSGIRDAFYDEINKLIELKSGKQSRTNKQGVDKDFNVSKLRNLENLINTRGIDFNSCIQELNDQHGFKYITTPNALSQIAQITFEEGSVGVGPGEAIFTLFTEAINPKKGDLEINGQEVELKSGKGRPGKAKTYSAIKKFQDHIMKDQLEANKFDEQIVQKCFTKIKQFFPINGGKKLSQKQTPTEISQIDDDITKIHGWIDDKKLSIKDKIDCIIKKLSLVRLRPTADVTQIYKGQPVVVTLTHQKDELKIFEGAEATHNNNWFSAVDDATFAQDITHMVIDNPEKSQMAGIIAAQLSEFQGNRLLIGSAIQVANYYLEQTGKGKESFEYYVLFNKHTFQILTIGPFTGKSYIEVFEMSLDSLASAGNQIAISPSTGGRGGWNITLGPDKEPKS